MRSMLPPLSAIRPATAAIADALSGRADDGHVRPAVAARPVVAGAAVDLDVMPRSRRWPRRRRGASSSRAGSVTSTPRIEPAPQHDLLDVDHLDAGAGQGGEDRRGHAGPVLAGERDEQRLRARAPIVVHRRHGSAGTRLSVVGSMVELHEHTHTTRSTTSRSASTDLARAHAFYGRPSAGGSTTTAPTTPASRLPTVAARSVASASAGPPARVASSRSSAPTTSTPASRPSQAAGGERRRGALRLPRRQAVHLRRPGRQRARRLPALRLVT